MILTPNMYIYVTDSAAFQHLRDLFPGLSEAKVKGGIFVGPQIRKVLHSEEFIAKLKPKEKVAWQSFRDVVENFLGNHKRDDYKDLVKNLVVNYGRMGCRMSVKLHFLHGHLEIFRDNMGNYSEEHGERFHQDMKQMETRYQGRYKSSMMGDYIWTLIRESDVEPARKSRRSTHF